MTKNLLNSKIFVIGLVMLGIVLLPNVHGSEVTLKQKENIPGLIDLSFSLKKSSSFDLVPSAPIEINSDGDFISYGFNGSGTAEDPYIIEMYNITTTSDRGIKVEGTTKYFVIRNCYVDAEYAGIWLKNIAEGTATIKFNVCSYNEVGITLTNTSGSTLMNNTFSNNNYVGMNLFTSCFCLVSYNLFQENKAPGIETSGSDNLFHHNRFVHNNLEYVPYKQARDYGKGNEWYDTETRKGNYWSDLGTDCKYEIGGGTNSKDLYPLNRAQSCPNPTVISTISIVLPILVFVAILAFLVPKYVIPYYRKQKSENRPLISRKTVLNILIISSIIISVFGVLTWTMVIRIDFWNEIGFVIIGIGNIG
ncbi:MAG: right-handed parallel beta-helix repeat-containing protein [Candidatus Heimdallarchaeota archaeon]|nr:right-handed parallel beta-helix repeat-containing protein [Candidatus Heimdallarchaeota archaeon]